jgi:enediyne biosynthesis protein E4
MSLISRWSNLVGARFGKTQDLRRLKGQTGRLLQIGQIGSRVLVTAKTVPTVEKPLVQMDELRSGGSYFSQNDMRMHFGLDQATKVDMVEIRWLSGQIDQLKDLEVNRLYVIQEGGKIIRSEALKPAMKS